MLGPSPSLFPRSPLAVIITPLPPPNRPGVFCVHPIPTAKLHRRFPWLVGRCWAHAPLIADGWCNNIEDCRFSGNGAVALHMANNINNVNILGSRFEVMPCDAP